MINSQKDKSIIQTYLEYIVGKMERALVRHLDLELLEDRPPDCLYKMTDNRRAFAGAIGLRGTQKTRHWRLTWHKDHNVDDRNL